MKMQKIREIAKEWDIDARIGRSKEISFGISRSRRAILPVFARKRYVKALASGKAIARKTGQEKCLSCDTRW
jgi:hypothetical protein